MERKGRRALDALRRKVAILAQGARKRGSEQEARGYEAVLTEFNQESMNVGERDPGLRAGKRISSTDAGTLARLGEKDRTVTAVLPSVLKPAKITCAT